MVYPFVMSEKRKIYAILGSAAILLLIAAIIAISFLLVKIKFVALELAQAEKFLEGLGNEQQDLIRLAREYQEIAPELNKINTIFLRKEKFLDLILILEEIAKRSGNQYDVKLLSEYAKEEGSALPTAILQISLRGSFNSLVKFLFYLENMPYLNKVKTMQVQRIEQGGAEQNLQPADVATKLDLKVYLAPEQSQ